MGFAHLDRVFEAVSDPVAAIGLTQADVDAFKGGKEATLTIVPFAAPDVKVALKVSLIGFTAGYEKATVQER